MLHVPRLARPLIVNLGAFPSICTTIKRTHPDQQAGGQAGKQAAPPPTSKDINNHGGQSTTTWPVGRPVHAQAESPSHAVSCHAPPSDNPPQRCTPFSGTVYIRSCCWERLRPAVRLVRASANAPGRPAPSSRPSFPRAPASTGGSAAGPRCSWPQPQPTACGTRGPRSAQRQPLPVPPLPAAPHPHLAPVSLQHSQPASQSVRQAGRTAPTHVTRQQWAWQGCGGSLQGCFPSAGGQPARAVARQLYGAW